MRRLFEGGVYSRAAFIRGNTVLEAAVVTAESGTRNVIPPCQMYRSLTPEPNVDLPFELIEERIFRFFFNNIYSVIGKD